MTRSSILLRRLATPVLAIMLFCYAILFAPLPFVAGWWQAGAADWLDPLKKRHRIAHGLLLTRALIGQPRGGIVALLGPPSGDGYFADWDLVYQLGAERGIFSIDSEWLVIRLDAPGRASEAATRTD